MKRNWSCNISHVYREQNKVVDLLANMGHELPLGMHQYEVAPDYLTNTLLEDKLGRAHARAVPA